MHGRACVTAVMVAGTTVLLAQRSERANDATPSSLAELLASAQQILAEAGVPGAGMALVRKEGIEWTGGIGWADRELKHPMTADTQFLAGSISKTLVALALVQLYEDGLVDLDAPVASVAPEVVIDNRWSADHPVRVRHLLEHTAGFDDAHVNEMFVPGGAPDRPLGDLLKLHPSSRRVRWRPGVRMAYSSPGYAVAARVVEVVSAKPFDRFIDERILRPLDMTKSGFLLPADGDGVAQGYMASEGPPAARRRLLLSPADGLYSSARDLGQFVEMLLGWGERKGSYVVDPEYLSNMEWPRTTAASAAGVRSGYGLGIHSTIDGPFHVLGHTSNIAGFASAYGYSPSRDVGFVVLLNASYGHDALTRLSTLAMRYLKRDVEPPRQETYTVPTSDLRRHEGYYHDANPRHSAIAAFSFPLGGRAIAVDGDALVMTPTLGPRVRLVPVNEGLFRRESELTASLAFTTVDGQPVLAGLDVYAEQRAKWPLDLLRAGLAASALLAIAAPFAGLIHARAGRRGGGVQAHALATMWALLLAVLAGALIVPATAPIDALASPTPRAMTVLACSALYPLLAFALLPLTILAHPQLGRRFSLFAAMVAAGHAGLTSYFGWWALLAFRTWTY